MMDNLTPHREYLESLRRDREWILQQIQESQGTLARSRELLQRLDELLTRERP
jgi:hypothetical protein